MNWFRFKACLKCRGDLVLDGGDWLCLQCGTYYYVGLANDGYGWELPPPPALARVWRQQKSWWSIEPPHPQRTLSLLVFSRLNVPRYVAMAELRPLTTVD